MCRSLDYARDDMFLTLRRRHFNVETEKFLRRSEATKNLLLPEVIDSSLSLRMTDHPHYDVVPEQLREFDWRAGGRYNVMGEDWRKDDRQFFSFVRAGRALEYKEQV